MRTMRECATFCKAHTHTHTHKHTHTQTHAHAHSNTQVCTPARAPHRPLGKTRASWASSRSSRLRAGTLGPASRSAGGQVGCKGSLQLCSQTVGIEDGPASRSAGGQAGCKGSLQLCLQTIGIEDGPASRSAGGQGGHSTWGVQAVCPSHLAAPLKVVHAGCSTQVAAHRLQGVQAPI